MTSASKGKQGSESFVGEPRDILEQALDGGKPEQAGLTLTVTQTNDAAIEINTVF